MKNVLIPVGLLILVLGSCAQWGQNPFFVEWNTPFQTPPFDKIKTHHFLPAFKEGIKQQQNEIDAIVNSTETPTFKNTVEALEKSDALLTCVNNVFYPLLGAVSTDKMLQISKEVAPLLSKNNDDIYLNDKLFERIKALYNQKDNLDLTVEQNKLLDEYYKEFVRGGANLDEEKKAELREINKELSVLTVQFGENVLNETNAFELVIENKENLAGLTDASISAAAETAKEKGYDGKWVFTTQKPSMIPFLQYSEKRNLREKIFKAYINKGDNNNASDNKEILKKIIALRIRKANILGYKTHADFVLEKNMAKTPENVYKLLDQIWKPAIRVAKKEAQELQELIDKEGNHFKLEPWDWWYYAEKLKKAKYDLDDEVLRPYFQLENVIQGAFTVANKLYGLQFVENKDIPTYNEDVKVYEVKEADGTHIGVLYTDYFPRTTKRSGAWMNAIRKQQYVNGKDIRPLITNNGNFSKPTGDKPALFSVDEVLTLFHEFGHGLHGLLSKCTYKKLSGTDVARDFVELPSQIMENWAMEPEVLKLYAKHFETGGTIPIELIQKIKKSGYFNQGFITTEYMAAAYLDMDWHTLTSTDNIDVNAFEKESMDRIGLIPEIVVRYRSTYFQHIVGGYDAGYYSYIWAEVLDKDAFQAFKETSLFDQKTAKAFRENILEKGGTENPMVLYKRFRGAEPKIDALLKGRGLK